MVRFQPASTFVSRDMATFWPFSPLLKTFPGVFSLKTPKIDDFRKVRESVNFMANDFKKKAVASIASRKLVCEVSAQMKELIFLREVGPKLSTG